MTKYHFNKDTGRTGKCEAKIKCRLGLSDSEHFETREEAQAAFEKTMEKKTSVAISKGKEKDLDAVKFDFTDKYPYDQDQNLNGRTAAEYRELISESVAKYAYRGDEFTDEIVGKMGIPNWKNSVDDYRYEANIVDNDKLELSHFLYDNAFGLPVGGTYEGYDYSQEVLDNLDLKDFINEDFVNHENFQNIQPHVGGYYNDDQRLVLTYRIPEELQEDAAGVLNGEKYRHIAYIAANPAFPDWAVLPANITLDQETKTFDNLDKLERPRFPSNKVRAIERKMHPQFEHERLTRNLENNKKQREEWENKLEQVKRARTKHNTTSSSNDYVNLETKVAPENLTRKQRARLQEKIEKRISDLENTYANNTEKLNNIKYDLSDKEIKGLWDTKNNLIDRHEESVRQYTIDKLSRHYPRSDESTRKREAAKWVDTHPDILRVIDF